MISGLRGSVARFGASSVVLDVGGVQYEVFVPLDVFAALQKTPAGEEVQVFIHHQFNQDEQKLYGFLDLGRRELFGAIRSLKGIGPALALSLLSHLDGPLLLDLCERQDVKGLSRIPRIGKTTAEMIVFEINRKLERWRKIVFAADPVVAGPGQSALDPPGSDRDELVVMALLQLGYKEKDARAALAKIPDRDDRDTGILIKAALQAL